MKRIRVILSIVLCFVLITGLLVSCSGKNSKSDNGDSIATNGTGDSNPTTSTLLQNTDNATGTSTTISTQVPTSTPTHMLTPTFTPTPTSSPTPTLTPSPAFTPTPTNTPSPTPVKNTPKATATPKPTATPSPTPTPATSKLPSDIDTILQQMTIREKVGQLFIVSPDVLNTNLSSGKASSNTATKLTDNISTNLKNYPVGGVIMFSSNITTPDQITTFNKNLQNASYIPLFISVDEEGGKVARLANNKAFNLTKYSSAAAVGKSGKSSDAQNMGSTIGAYLKKYGFNMDFAPVADVNTNPNNPVIGNRAFSSDAKTVSLMAAAMATGLRQQNIIPVFKHFPGHGDTAEDSHSGLAISYKTEAEMQSCEWLSFSEAGNESCIMVGHIAVPNVTGDYTPSTMSSKVVTDILRNQMGFQGLIITDSLSMGAITEAYSSGEAAVAAFNAGCDILLMPYDFKNAFDAVLLAVENGKISEQKLDESVKRILQFKQAYGILAI